jgi:hypothetical protein
MKPTLNEKFLAYLALFSGLTLSVVAEYYSILGLTAIFAAAVIPVVIMGIALGLGKITATLWLKQNWTIAPWTVRSYLFVAILVLMLITSMGIFGFLSKAHSDQSLVSGDVAAKIAVYDEKIKVAKDNIDANRKALKQMDEAVDQVMGRSQDEKGADKAVALRRGQAKERTRLLSEITAEQKVIAQLSEERAPIAAEVRKVEAEVGPIKYIAAFVYGNTDTTVLEKAVTWVIIILIVVFDPLAVILLLASQISFQNFREREASSYGEWTESDFDVLAHDGWVSGVGEPPTEEEKKSIDDFVPQPKEYIPEEGDSPLGTELVVDGQDPTVTTSTVEPSILEQHPYLNQPFAHFQNLEPMVYKPEGDKEWERWVEHAEVPEVEVQSEPTATDITEEVVQQALEETHEIKAHGSGDYIVINGQTYNKNSIPPSLQGYVQNEEQKESSLWSIATGNPIQPEDYFRTSKTKKE